MTATWMHNAHSFETLDARESDPGTFLPLVLSRADALDEGQGLHVIQAFEPVPLYTVLGAKGFEYETVTATDVEVHVYFYRTPTAPAAIDPKASVMKEHLDVDPVRIVAIQGIVESFCEGADAPTLKQKFETEIGSITGAEFAFVEQKMTEVGVADSDFKEHVEDLIRIFRSALASHEADKREPGHPLDTFRRENTAVAALVAEIHDALSVSTDEVDPTWWADKLGQLAEVDLHYIRKENQLFPRLEAKGFDKPSTVMWQIHDDIRESLKAARQALLSGDHQRMLDSMPAILDQIVDMIFKEEKVLFPTSEAMLTEEDWNDVRRGEEEVGYCLIGNPPDWPLMGADSSPISRHATFTAVPAVPFVAPPERPKRVGGISLEEGSLTPEQVSLLLKHLPMDVAYVDLHDEVSYANHDDSEAHLSAAKSDMAMFKSGTHDVVDTWSIDGDHVFHTTNTAVRDDDGRYRGTLLTRQEVSAIRALTGEQRLLEWR